MNDPGSDPANINDYEYMRVPHTTSFMSGSLAKIFMPLKQFLCV